MSVYQILYGLSILLTGLLAGLFYGFQCSVINGLGALPDKEYLSAFQSINKAILNPVFFASFMGSIIVLPITSYISFNVGAMDILPYLITSTLVYGIGVFAITIFCNVPLNESLAAFDIESATENQIHTMRLSFEGNWNKWHLIRTIASVFSFIVLLVPLIRRVAH